MKSPSYLNSSSAPPQHSLYLKRRKVLIGPGYKYQAVSFLPFQFFTYKDIFGTETNFSAMYKPDFMLKVLDLQQKIEALKTEGRFGKIRVTSRSWRLGLEWK